MFVFLMLYLCLLIAQNIITLSDTPVVGQRLENTSPEYTTKMKIFGAPSICINPKKHVKTEAGLNTLKACCQNYINEQLSLGENTIESTKVKLRDCVNSLSVGNIQDFKQCEDITVPDGVIKETTSQETTTLKCENKDKKFIKLNKDEITVKCVGDRWIYLKNEKEYYVLSDKTLKSLMCETPMKAHANGYCEATQLHFNSKCKVIEDKVEKEFICKKNGWISFTPNGIKYTSQMKELGAPTICIYPEESVDSQIHIDSLKACCRAYIKEHFTERNTIEQIRTNLSSCVDNVSSSHSVVDFRQCKEITDAGRSNDFEVETNGNKKTLKCRNGMTFRYFNEAEITLRCVGHRWVYLTENTKFYVISDEKVKSLECETIEKSYEDPTCNSNLVDENTQCKVIPKDNKTYVCQNKIWKEIGSKDKKGPDTEDKADNDGTDTKVTEKETDGYSSVCPVVLITLFSMML